MALPPLLLAALGLFQTLGVGQHALAHTDALRSDLKQLIVGDKLECRLDGDVYKRQIVYCYTYGLLYAGAA